MEDFAHHKLKYINLNYILNFITVMSVLPSVSFLTVLSIFLDLWHWNQWIYKVGHNPALQIDLWLNSTLLNGKLAVCMKVLKNVSHVSS